YLVEFRSAQTGGVNIQGEPIVTKQSSTKSAVTLALILGILVAGVVSIVLMVRRTTSRRIASAADLSLYPQVVSLGELAELDPHVLHKISAGSEKNPGRVVVT